MKGVLPWLVRWARRAGTRDFCPAFVAVVGTVQNNFCLTPHYFGHQNPESGSGLVFSLKCWIRIRTHRIRIRIQFVPIAQQARQAVVLGQPVS
jgi:hypothetical protein